MSFLLHFYSWCACDLRLSYQQFKRSEFVMAMTLLNSLVDLSSIENCVKDNYTPKFAQFRLENADLRDSSGYPKCLQTLLMQDIMIKKRRVTLVMKNMSLIRNILIFKFKWVDFHRICNLFLNESFCGHQNI